MASFVVCFVVGLHNKLEAIPLFLCKFSQDLTQ